MSLKPRREKDRMCLHSLHQWILLQSFADADTPLEEQPEFPKSFRSALWSCVAVQEGSSAALPWWFHSALLFFIQMIFLRNVYLAGKTIKENSASAQRLCGSSERFPRSGTSLSPLLPSATAISASFDVDSLTSCRAGVGREKVELPCTTRNMDFPGARLQPAFRKFLFWNKRIWIPFSVQDIYEM